ncbi:hypothetical protein ACWIGW_16705 [Nocardia brasiliensis]
MLMKKILAGAAVVSIAGGTVGTATAESESDALGFTAQTRGSAAVITLDSGSFAVTNGRFEVKDDNGKLLTSTPLTFDLDDFEFPLTADISGRTATLTPQFDMRRAVYKPVALPFQEEAGFKNRYQREQAAWRRMTSTIKLGATIGTLVGGIGGAAVGCVLGGLAGATVASATIIGLFGAFLPAAAIGCLGGVIAVGALGALAGRILVTAPVAIGAAIQYFTTINEPLVVG